MKDEFHPNCLTYGMMAQGSLFLKAPRTIMVDIVAVKWKYIDCISLGELLVHMAWQLNLICYMIYLQLSYEGLLHETEFIILPDSDGEICRHSWWVIYNNMDHIMKRLVQ